MKKLFRLLSVSIVLASVIGVTGCSSPQEETVITVRLWDENVAKAYDQSFEELYKETGIRAETVVVPWAQYWTQIRADLSTQNADDVFWLNAGNFESYAAEGLLKPITEQEFPDQWQQWDTSVIDQYTAEGTLWGVPQLSDPGIGLLYNKDLLDKYGVTVSEVESLAWDPAQPTDSLRSVTQKLTVDSNGNTPASEDFDPARTQIYGFNAACDLNAIVLNFLGSNGAAWQEGDTFVFDTPPALQTFEYLTQVINTNHVAPPAADTNPPAGENVSRDLFLQGKMALFETGAYNLANVHNGAQFEWGIATIPRGPAGAISVTNGIIAAANATSQHPEEQLKVLQWLGGKGAAYIGAEGSALTAVKSERSSYFDYWKSQGIDVTPMISVLDNGYVQAPRGARYAQAQEAYLPILNDVFLTNISVNEGIPAAVAAANAAMKG